MTNTQTMTNNIKQALELEDQFVINVVNEILAKEYKSSYKSS